MSITFGGLASGLDTNALIDGLLGVERIPLQRNQAEQIDLTSARDALSTFMSNVAAVKTAAEELDTEGEFASFSSSITGNGGTDRGLVVTTTGAALAGTYNISVDRLASETRTRSNNVADASADLAMDGALEITVGGSASVSVAVNTGDSLTDIAAAINDSDARVNASVIFDGTESVLLVRGNDTGDANQVVFNETGTVDLGLDEPSNTYQNAQDAQITIDDQGPSGFGGFVIERSTNQFREVIPGITFTATEVTTSDLQVEIAPDFDQQADKIQSFIDAYNAAISSGRRSAGFGTVNAVNRNLQSDSSIRTALDRLGRTVSSPVDGLTGRYNQLAAVGVELTREGDLSLDRSTLEEALAADPDAVAKVFAGDPNNGIDGIMTTLIGVVESLAEGDDSVLETRIDAFDARIDRLAEDELTLARRLEDFETRLRREFTDLEILISQINEQAAGLAGLSNTVPQASSNNNS